MKVIILIDVEVTSQSFTVKGTYARMTSYASQSVVVTIQVMMDPGPRHMRRGQKIAIA